MIKIRVQGLYKIFGPHPRKAMDMLAQGKSKEEIMADTRHGVGVNNVSFNVQEGETVVVMGLSGSGKSTLVRCLNRLITPTAGSIFIDDQDILTMNERELRQVRQQKLVMVFKIFAIFPHRTVLENAALGL
jgi:glycine betaine/proline transport system ATP-binding protein